ncbi:MAG: hypothetical protein JWP19_2042 [Rhodoglobus sp.]|nr:hypothetical protein [Rhodoglobus sp.]
MTPGDEIDPSDWLADQFGEEPPKPAARRPEHAPPTEAPPVAPSAVPQAAPPPAASAASPGPGVPFQWGLTPGADPAEAAPQPQPPVTPPPVQPTYPTYTPPPEQPTAPPATQPPYTATPLGEPARDPYNQQPQFPVEHLPWDAPTTAFPAAPTEALLGQAVQPVPQVPEPSQWFAAPLDPALDGVTEVFEAELVGLSAPVGEGLAASAIDDLFGDSQFRDFGDEPLIAPPPPRSPGRGGGGKPPGGPREPIPRNQKILIWVAGGLVAALALVALFALGMRLASLAPAPAVTPSASPSPSPMPTLLPVGPIQPGVYHWDALLGGECLKPYTSAWQDEYTVVDCATPHPAQMAHRGTFDDPASATYPGLDELQKRINLLCTAPTVIDYAVAGTAQDIQVTASFAADEQEWDAGNHSYFCFVTRSTGADLTASVAIPQVAVAPAPAPPVSATPGAPVTRGHADGPPKTP